MYNLLRDSPFLKSPPHPELIIRIDGAVYVLNTIKDRSTLVNSMIKDNLKIQNDINA